MLTTYQAYISVTSTMLLLYIVQKLMEDKSYASELFIIGLKSLLYLAAIAAAYFAVTMLILKILGGGLNDYATGYVSSDKSVIQRVTGTYQNFFEILVKQKLNIVNNSYSTIVHLGSITIILAELIMITFCLKDVKKSALMVLCMVLLPVSMNAMFLVFKEQGVRAMMSFGFIGIYIVAAILIDHINWTRQAIVREVLMWCLALVIVNNVCIANKTALRMHLAYENAHSFFTTVLADVKMTPGFDEECKLAIIGYTDVLIYPLNELGNDNVNGARKDLINEYSREAFIAYFCGFHTEYANAEEQAEIIETEEFKAMPRYPYYGSIKRIDDVLVVKLDEIPLA